MTEKIILNGEELYNGDSKTLGVIFNNLTGKNFQEQGKYEEYLKYMKGVTGIEIKGELCRVGNDGEEKNKAEIR